MDCGGGTGKKEKEPYEGPRWAYKPIHIYMCGLVFVVHLLCELKAHGRRGGGEGERGRGKKAYGFKSRHCSALQWTQPEGLELRAAWEWRKSEEWW